MAPKKSYAETMAKLQDTPAYREGGAPQFIVPCPICRHKWGFVTERQGQLKLADIRRALVSFTGRAIHKFLN